MTTITNQTKNSATITNVSLSQRILGLYTIAEVATKTLVQLGPKAFTDKYMVFTNETKH